MKNATIKQWTIFGSCCLFIGLCGWASYCMGRFAERDEILATQQHDLCYDTKTHWAYVAYKGAEVMCFMRKKDWPHKVTASVIE